MLREICESVLDGSRLRVFEKEPTTSKLQCMHAMSLTIPRSGKKKEDNNR